MTNCCICKTRKATSYHVFPKDPNLRAVWLQFFSMSANMLKGHTQVCSNHFAEDCFTVRGKQRHLKKDSVPTILHAKESCLNEKKDKLKLPKSAVPKEKKLKKPAADSTNDKRAFANLTIVKELPPLVINNNNNRISEKENTDGFGFDIYHMEESESSVDDLIYNDYNNFI